MAAMPALGFVRMGGVVEGDETNSKPRDRIAATDVLVLVFICRFHIKAMGRRPKILARRVSIVRVKCLERAKESREPTYGLLK